MSVVSLVQIGKGEGSDEGELSTSVSEGTVLVTKVVVVEVSVRVKKMVCGRARMKVENSTYLTIIAPNSLPYHHHPATPIPPP